MPRWLAWIIALLLTPVYLIWFVVRELRNPTVLFPCPCCGFETIRDPGSHENCHICWWEDDGQDNQNANVVMGGPNYDLSLTRARINFLKHGISDPTRGDLREFQASPEYYAKAREFVLDDTGDAVFEPATGWRGSLADEEE